MDNTISRDEAESLRDFIEVNFFEQIKNDPDTDNMEFVYNVCQVWKKCVNIMEYNYAIQSAEEDK